MTALTLLVLRSAQPEKTLAFYQALGLVFIQEQHGTGPVHYAYDSGTQVIEIYPAEHGTAPDRKSGGATMLGFSVPALDDVLVQLQAMDIMPLNPPKDLGWGRQVTVLDPDGRAVQLVQTKNG